MNGERVEKERIPLVVYPNSGEVYDIERGWYGRENCMPLENYVSEWVKYGAQIIGGCCRTYARDIRRISVKVQSLTVNK